MGFSLWLKGKCFSLTFLFYFFSLHTFVSFHIILVYSVVLGVYKELLISFALKRNEPKKRASPQVPPQGGNQPLAYARSYIKDDGHS